MLKKLNLQKDLKMQKEMHFLAQIIQFSEI